MKDVTLLHNAQCTMHISDLMQTVNGLVSRKNFSRVYNSVESDFSDILVAAMDQSCSALNSLYFCLFGHCDYNTLRSFLIT